MKQSEYQNNCYFQSYLPKTIPGENYVNENRIPITRYFNLENKKMRGKLIKDEVKWTILLNGNKS